MLTLSAVIIHVMPYLEDLGVPRSTAALVAGGIPLLSVLGRFGLGYMGDAFPKRHILCTSILLTGLGLVAFAHAQTGWLIVVFLALFPLGFGGVIVMRGAILRELFGTVFFGRLIGIVFGAGAVGGVIGPVVAGWAFDVHGSYVYVWLIFCALNILSMGLSVRVRPLTRLKV